METHKDVLLWLKAVSVENDLKKRFSYGNTSLWLFYEYELALLVTNLINGKYEYSHNFFTKYATKLPKYYYLYSLAKVIARFVLGKLFSGKPVENSGREKVLAVSDTGYWKNFPTMQKKGLDQDTILGDIITTLRDTNFNVVALDTDSSPLIDVKTMMEKRGLWKPVETYLTFNMVSRAFRASRRYKREWDNLKNNKRFIGSLNYNGFPLFGSLKHELGLLFEQRTFETVLFIELMRRAIGEEKPDLILTTYEYGLTGRAAVVAGKLEGVPTLAVQHGNINPAHSGYVHTKDEISTQIAPEYYILPDKTAVYGTWVKKVLVENNNYPEDSVAVTGQARYDILAKADKIFDKEKFCRRYGLDPHKKIALACIDDPLALKGVLGALGEFPEVQLVIKPHPNEKGKWYEEMAKEQKTKALILQKNSNTYEVICACDVMLSFFSTTITEAIILNKPVITINLTGRPDIMPYAESGAAIGVYRQEDVAPAMEKALYERDTKERLREARARFIPEHCYKIDGKASERLVGLITEMMAGV